MKNDKLIALLLCVIVAIPSVSHAQSDASEFAISFGGALPTGDFDDGFSAGPSLGLEWTRSSGSSVAYGVGLHLNKYGIDPALKNFVPGIDLTSYGVEAVGVIKFHLASPESKTKFYFKGQGGIGTLSIKASGFGSSASATETKGLFGGGFGVTFRGEGTTGGHVELLYNGLLTEGSTATYITVRGGVTLFLGERN